MPTLPPQPNPWLGSLKQISDHPLYELHYVGDYGFGQRAKQGARPSGWVQPALSGFACSVFAAAEGSGQRVMGRNFDWGPNPAVLLFTRPPGAYASVAMVDISYLGYDRQKTPLTDPGALKNAPYLPFDGMNEHGLAVGMMAISHAEGGNDPQKVTLDELEMIRLMLDYARNVPEALQLIQGYNVDFGSVPIHYLISDAAGNSAVIEYLDGKPVVLPNTAPWQVSTNFLISVEKPQGANSSCSRYNQLSTTLARTNGQLGNTHPMDLLKGVSQANTRWSVVYHLATGKVSLVMGRNYDQVYETGLK